MEKISRLADHGYSLLVAMADRDEQPGKTRVSAQRIEPRLHFEPDQPGVALRQSFFEPGKGQFVIALTEVDQRPFVRRDVLLLR